MSAGVRLLQTRNIKLVDSEMNEVYVPLTATAGVEWNRTANVLIISNRTEAPTVKKLCIFGEDRPISRTDI